MSALPGGRWASGLTSPLNSSRGLPQFWRRSSRARGSGLDRQPLLAAEHDPGPSGLGALTVLMVGLYWLALRA
jgi:hypothetical protein